MYRQAEASVLGEGRAGRGALDAGGLPGRWEGTRHDGGSDVLGAGWQAASAGVGSGACEQTARERPTSKVARCSLLSGTSV